MGLSRQQTQAAREFAVAAANAFVKDGNMHPGTTVAAAARMAGTLLFRTFGLPLEGVAPGQVVLSQEANAKGPALIELTAQYLAAAGVTLDPSQAGVDSPPRHAPALPFLDTQRTLEPTYTEIHERLGLTRQDAALAAAVATGIIIQHCAPVLDPSTGFSIAALGFVEGTKTVPG